MSLLVRAKHMLVQTFTAALLLISTTLVLAAEPLMKTVKVTVDHLIVPAKFLAG